MTAVLLTARSNMGVPPGCWPPSALPDAWNSLEESQLTRRLSFSN